MKTELKKSAVSLLTALVLLTGCSYNVTSPISQSEVQGDQKTRSSYFYRPDYLIFTHHDLKYQKDLKASRANVIPGDFNGDGKMDFLKQSAFTTSKIYYSIYGGPYTTDGSEYNDVLITGTAPLGVAYQDELIQTKCNLIPGDFDGNGYTDFIRQEKGYVAKDNVNTFNVYLNTGNGFNVIIPDSLTYQLYCKGNDSGEHPSGVNIIPGDYDGDGKTDFIRQEKGEWAKDDISTFQVFFSNGDGTFRIVTPQGDQYQKYCKADDGVNLIPGDFNGDGKTDLIKQEKGVWAEDDYYTFQLFFSRGDGYFDRMTPEGDQYQKYLKGDNGVNIIPGDFNGDGKTDFIKQEKGGWATDNLYTIQIYYSRGNGYFDIYTPTHKDEMVHVDLKADPGVNMIPADFDNDGICDFIRQEKGQLSWDDKNSFKIYFTRMDHQKWD